MKNQKKNISWWKKLLGDIPPAYAKWFNYEKDFLRKHIKKHAKVLEVGCGDGRSLTYIKDITKNIVGIDINKKAINYAKKILPELKFQVADGKDLPFEENSFDFVICMTTPANFGSDRQKFYSEMKRVLKPSGEIIINVFNEDAMPARMEIYKKFNAPIKEVIGGKVIFEDVGPSEQFSKQELEEIFKKAELEIIEITKQGMGYFCRLRKNLKEAGFQEGDELQGESTRKGEIVLRKGKSKRNHNNP